MADTRKQATPSMAAKTVLCVLLFGVAYAAADCFYTLGQIDAITRLCLPGKAVR